MSDSPSAPSVKPQLGLWDAISIIVGIVIGTTIYKMPGLIANNLGSPLEVLGVWAFGGLLSLVGALCYAELATTYPRLGGDYIYLTRAFGRCVGFLFGWAQLAVLFASNIGAMTFVFGAYAAELLDLDKKTTEVWFALGAVLVLTALNVAGVFLGKWTQNVLTAIKILGLGIILVAGLCSGGATGASWTESQPLPDSSVGLAMIFVLFGFGGWNDAAFVAAEVRDCRNIARSLLLSIAIITAVYLLVNLAYLNALGLSGVRGSQTVAADTVRPLFGDWGARAMAALVMVSALGAANGLIFTGARLFTALGAEHRVFAWLGRWHPRLGTPAVALLAQGTVTLALIGLVGTVSGQKALDAVWQWFGRNPILWDKKFHGGFETLVSVTAPIFWLFFFLTGAAFFVLRFRDASVERPFRLSLPWFPLLPLIFCGMCLYMFHAAVTYAEDLSAVGFVALLAGVPVYVWSSWKPPVPSVVSAKHGA